MAWDRKTCSRSSRGARGCPPWTKRRRAADARQANGSRRRAFLARRFRDNRLARLAITGNIMDDCIFCKIVRGEVPSKKVYEDDEVLGFQDIRPLAPVHFMLVPKRHIPSLADAAAADAGVLGRMLTLSGKLAREQGSPDGFRTIINSGRIGRQDVMHLHMHVIGGPEPLGAMMPKSNV